MKFWSWLGLLPTKRQPWALLALIALALELCALYFQHVLRLDPCVMCIYERCALFGLFVAGLIGLCAPRWAVLRWGGLLTWLGSSAIGLKLAWDHMQLQRNPPFLPSCASSPDFPTWLPLNRWLPQVFEAYGPCEEVSWQFAGLTMVEWLVVIFSLSLLAALLVGAAHLYRCCRRS